VFPLRAFHGPTFLTWGNELSLAANTTIVLAAPPVVTATVMFHVVVQADIQVLAAHRERLRPADDF
jgi:hypothetical protein